ncbi:hypothetical protein HYV70_03020 [Candidatus Uhrbacteria bacterium]|nr:hypothetical protein [Candidatus Uhrbacteria bacterium]
MKIVIDGNDGTGKSTIVALLREQGYDVQDRGIPTKMTDNESVAPQEDEFYLILDVPVELSRARLAKAGRNLNEKYHTVEDLTHYRERFLQIAQTLPNSVLVNATGSPDEVLAECLQVINRVLEEEKWHD